MVGLLVCRRVGALLFINKRMTAGRAKGL